jgi:hypothetical protein
MEGWHVLPVVPLRDHLALHRERHAVFVSGGQMTVPHYQVRKMPPEAIISG